MISILVMSILTNDSGLSIFFVLAVVYRPKYLNENSVMFSRMHYDIPVLVHTHLSVHTLDYFYDSMIMCSLKVETIECVAVRSIYS
jgi:hypothetical protein